MNALNVRFCGHSCERFANFPMNCEFADIIRSNESDYGLSLTGESRLALERFYRQVQEFNPLLHLVAPCSAEEFAKRHVLESLTMLESLPTGAAVTDIGAGAGFPSLPCLIVRRDLTGTLIESKPKKVEFLRKAIAEGSLGDRVRVIDKQFEEAERPSAGFVTCRALDKFTERLPRILKWAASREFLFFGGPSLRQSLEKQHISFREKLMPFSERRFLFVGKIPAKTGRR